MCFYVQCRQTHNDALITTRDKKREARLYLFRFCIIIFKSIYNTHRL